ncbi:MAG: hypothetical protein IJJ60_08660 [Clostridia bacterium]|nr:hypothetical protein [Clostridia bacterium]
MGNGIDHADPPNGKEMPPFRKINGCTVLFPEKQNKNTGKNGKMMIQ